MSHYQIIATTIEMKGDNAYLHNKGGLDFGVQVSYLSNEDNIDVESIVERTPVENPAEIIVKKRTKKIEI